MHYTAAGTGTVLQIATTTHRVYSRRFADNSITLLLLFQLLLCSLHFLHCTSLTLFSLSHLWYLSAAFLVLAPAKWLPYQAAASAKNNSEVPDWERERELKLRKNEKVEEVDHWIWTPDQTLRTTFRICMRLSTATFTLCVGSTWLPTIIAVIWRQWPKPNDSMSKKRKREREATKLKTASVSSFLFLLLQLLLLLTVHSWQRQRRTPCWEGRLLKTYDYLSYLFFPLFDQNTHKPNYTNHLTIEWL